MGRPKSDVEVDVEAGVVTLKGTSTPNMDQLIRLVKGVRVWRRSLIR